MQISQIAPKITFWPYYFFFSKWNMILFHRQVWAWAYFLGFLFFFFLINLFIYLFIFGCVGSSFSVRGLSLVAASGRHSSSRCAGLSLLWSLLLRSTGSRRAGSAVVAHGPSCSAACGIFPDQDSNPCPLHWQADSQPLHHQGSPDPIIFHSGSDQGRACPLNYFIYSLSRILDLEWDRHRLKELSTKACA